MMSAPQSTRQACSFFLKRKNRYCRNFPPKPGLKFCGEHSECETGFDRVRIRCPLENTHTCYADALADHLKRCPARKAQSLDDFTLADVSAVSRVLWKIQDCYANAGLEDEFMPEMMSRACVETSHTDDSDNKKHLSQVSSIIAHMDANALLQNHCAYLEFGAGRAVAENLSYKHVSFDHIYAFLCTNPPLYPEHCLDKLKRPNFRKRAKYYALLDGKLAYWISRAIADTFEANANCGFVLIERDGTKHKFDGKLKSSVVPEENNNGSSYREFLARRIHCDVRHLNLKKIDLLSKFDKCVAVCKHLCGNATDLSITALANCLKGDDRPNLVGLAFAPCCHHRCSWPDYVGKRFLLSHHFTQREFALLASISSWATCGFELSNPQPDPLGRDFGLSAAEKADFGRKVKRILDFGRLDYLRQELKLDCHAKLYIDSQITPENSLLCGRLLKGVAKSIICK